MAYKKITGGEVISDDDFHRISKPMQELFEHTQEPPTHQLREDMDPKEHHFALVEIK